MLFRSPRLGCWKGQISRKIISFVMHVEYQSWQHSILFRENSFRDNCVAKTADEGDGRWEDLDDSPVTWHIVGDIASKDYDPFNTEPWQLAVNGIY